MEYYLLGLIFAQHLYFFVDLAGDMPGTRTALTGATFNLQIPPRRAACSFRNGLRHGRETPSPPHSENHVLPEHRSRTKRSFTTVAFFGILDHGRLRGCKDGR